MRFRSLPLATALLAMPFAAAAQPFQGIYIGAGAGYNLPQNYPLAAGGQLEPSGGFVGLGSIGYGLGNGMRFELEGNYRHAHLGRSTTAFSPSGSAQTYGVMANALFDLDVGAPWIYPYLGGGLGYAWTHLSSGAGIASTSVRWSLAVSARPREASHFRQSAGCPSRCRESRVCPLPPSIVSSPCRAMRTSPAYN